MEKTAKRIGIAVIAVLLVALLCVGIALALPQAETPLASSDSGSGAELATANVVKVNGTTYDLDTYEGAMAYYDYLTTELEYHGIKSQAELIAWARDEVDGNHATSLQGKAALKPYDDNRNKITYYFGGYKTFQPLKFDTTTGASISEKDGGTLTGYVGYDEPTMYNSTAENGQDPEIFRAAFDGCGANVVLRPPRPWENAAKVNSVELTDAQVNETLGQGSALTLIPNSGGAQSMYTGAFGTVAIGARIANFNFSFPEDTKISFCSDPKDKGVYTGGLFGAMINCTVNNCSVDIPSTTELYGAKGLTNANDNNVQATNPGYGTLSFGGIAGYSYGTSFTNIEVALNGTITLNSQGRQRGTIFATYWGTLRAFAGGIVGMSQGVTMHNVTVSGKGTVTADVNEPWNTDKSQYARAGALIGMDFSETNSEVTTLGWAASGGTSNINGIITTYTGGVTYPGPGSDTHGNDNGGATWTTTSGVLFGSCASSELSGVYYTQSAPTKTVAFTNNSAYKITATSDTGSGVTVGFVNNAYPVKDCTSDDQEYIVYNLGAFENLDVTYTVPDAVAGEIVWAYTVNDGAEQTLYDKQDKGQSSFTLKHDFTTAQDTVYKFTTGTRVTFEVLGKNDEPLSDEEYAGEGKNVVDSKQFDNKRFAVPKLRVVDLEGNNFLGGDNNVLHFNNDVSTGTAVWSIWKGNNSNVDGATAAGAGDYTYRFRTNTTEDLFYFINVNDNERVIAYKSDNYPDVSRVYSYHIDPKAVEVSVEGSEFTYDTNPQKPNFTWKWVDGDASVPTLNISYKNAEGGALAEAQVTEAGSYTATVSQFASNANYTITNLDALQNVAFTIAPRPLTLDFTVDESRPYNGAPQSPDVTVGNLPTNVIADVAVNKYYFNGSDTASDDIVASDIVNVGDYMLRVAPASENYVIDTEKVTGTSGSVSEAEAWKMFSITKADVEFKGAEDGVYKFTYGTLVRTLNDLNTALGNTGYYFQPVDSNNEVDKNLGGNQTFEITSAPAGTVANMILHAGSYTIKVSYPGNDNLNSATEEINVTVDKRPLYLNLDKPEISSYEYGTSPEFVYDENQQATNAVANDRMVFGMVFYRNDDGSDVINPENKIPNLQGAYPKAVGKYIASFEPISSSSAVDIYNNYYISEDSDNTFAYEITPATLTVTFNDDLISTIPYDGEEHSPATIVSVGGIIDSEQHLYNKDTLKVFYVNETGDSASSARNAGTYTLAVAPEAGSEQFMTNYKIGDESMKTFTIEKAPLTLQLQDVEKDYMSVKDGQIPYDECVTITDGQIFGNDNQDENGEWLLNIFVYGEVLGDGQVDVSSKLDGIGLYIYSLERNTANANVNNYDITMISSDDAAAYENLEAITGAEAAGTINVIGTEVAQQIMVYDEDNNLVGFANLDQDGSVTVHVTYTGGELRAEFAVRNSNGSTRELAFKEPKDVTGEGVSSGVRTEEATEEGATRNIPYITARNAGTYTAIFELTDESKNKYYLVSEKTSEDGSEVEGGEYVDNVVPLTEFKVTFVIDPREVTVTPNAVEQTYGDEFKDAGYSVAGDDGTIAAMLAADGFAPNITSTTDASTPANTTGEVTLTQAFAAGSEGNAKNYVFTPEEGSVTVVPRPVTVSLEMSNNTVTYGDDLPTVTVVSGENFVSDDDATAMAALIGEQLVYDRNAGVDKVPTLKTSAIGNYTVTLADGTGKITITAKQISGVSVAAGKMPYGGSAENITPVDGVFFTENPGFLEEDLDKLDLAFKYVGQRELSELEPGDHADALQLTITDEVMSGNYNITASYASNGDLTVQAMDIDSDNVKVTLKKDTYDGTVIDYDIFVGTVNVTDADPTRLSVTINGSADTKIKDAGKYVFAIKGDEVHYKGNVTVTKTVAQADISGVVFGLDKTSATYTGSAIEVKANTTIDIEVSLEVTQDGKEAQLVNAGIYTVTVTATDPNYTGSMTFPFTIDRAPHKAPVIDELTIEAAWNSVTVTHDEFTVQLSKDGNDPWVDTTMEGYEANSDYRLHVRFKEDDNHSLGGSTIISGKTAERTAVEFEISDVEEHYNRAVLTITFEEAFSGTVKFSIDGGKNWNDLTAQGGKYVASGLAESREYTLQVQIPKGDDYLASEVKSVKVKTGIDPAKYTETLAMFGETFSAGDLVNYETLKEQYNGLTEADKAGVDADKFATITAARDAFVASVNSDIEDIQNVAAKTAGRAVAAAAAAVTAAAIALFIAKRKFI